MIAFPVASNLTLPHLHEAVIGGFDIIRYRSSCDSLAVLKLGDDMSGHQGGWVRLGDDFHALGLKGADGCLDVLFHQNENKSVGWCIFFASDKVRRHVCPCKFKLDPSPSLPAHWLIRHDSAVEMPRVEFLGALLIDHRKLRKLYVHLRLSIELTLVLDRLVLSSQALRSAIDEWD
jgi:hypothetical protein